jgi:hypothetical protein
MRTYLEVCEAFRNASLAEDATALNTQLKKCLEILSRVPPHIRWFTSQYAIVLKYPTVKQIVEAV